MKVCLLESVIGGSLLSLCVSCFSVFYGRVIGISGIVNNAIFKGQVWQMSFLCGMWAVGFFQEEIRMSRNLGSLVISGFMVGVGVSMGNGCTSGHGLCGMARLSKRSIVAVLTFMMTAIMTRFFINDLENSVIEYHNSINISKNNQILLIVGVLGAFLGFLLQVHMVIVSWFVGMMFAIGLSIGGMVYPEKVLGFLNLGLGLFDFQQFKVIDPSLGIVFASGLFPNFIVHQIFTTALKTPLLDSKWHFSHKTIIDFKLITGAILFGLGWGLGGLCPGPAVTLLPQYLLYGNYSILVWWVGMLSGMYLVIKMTH